MSQNIDYSKGIYDARQLGGGRMLILGIQHMFAMFGATVLVPLLTGLSVSTTLLCAGLGTLLFHFITKRKVPAFLGSSFAYLGGFSIVAPMLADADGNLTVANTQMLPYACAGVAFSGLVYLVVSLLISTFGIRRIMRFFPPVVTGPIIIAIGLILAPSAINNCQANWLLAFVALGTVIICNIWGKGMVKILPILIGVLVSYAVALVTGAVDFERIASAAWFGIPLHKEAMGLFAIDGSPEFISALFTIIPIALATMMEHVGDIAAISATVGHNYINDPGLNRTLMGDGLATTLAGLLGGPANTTYGENTGVLALSKIYDPLVIRIAAVLAIILSLSLIHILQKLYGADDRAGRRQRLPPLPEAQRSVPVCGAGVGRPCPGLRHGPRLFQGAPQRIPRGQAGPQGLADARPCGEDQPDHGLRGVQERHDETADYHHKRNREEAGPRGLPLDDRGH